MATKGLASAPRRRSCRDVPGCTVRDPAGPVGECARGDEQTLTIVMSRMGSIQVQHRERAQGVHLRDIRQQDGSQHLTQRARPAAVDVTDLGSRADNAQHHGELLGHLLREEPSLLLHQLP